MSNPTTRRPPPNQTTRRPPSITPNDRTLILPSRRQQLQDYPAVPLVDTEDWYDHSIIRQGYDDVLYTAPEIRAIRESQTILLPTTKVRNKRRNGNIISLILYTCSALTIMGLYMVVPLMNALAPYINNALNRLYIVIGLLLAVELVVLYILLRTTIGNRPQRRNLETTPTRPSMQAITRHR